jgi:cell division protein FtsQ
MSLKRQPRAGEIAPTSRAQRAPRKARARSGAARPRGGGRGRQARRPGTPLRRRLATRIPALGRLVAVVSAAATAAALVALVNGPWLRVANVAAAGGHYTDDNALADLLGQAEGDALLAVDTAALAARIESLPAVAEARVEGELPATLRAWITERTPAFAWHTPARTFLGDAEGVLFAALSADHMPADAAGLPRIDDASEEGRVLRVGDRLAVPLVRAALRLAALDPQTLGSAAMTLSLRVDDQYGLILVSAAPEWQIAFGLPSGDPLAHDDGLEALLDEQVTAVRTLFATRTEDEIGWVDARNPGKVYFRAKG